VGVGGCLWVSLICQCVGVYGSLWCVEYVSVLI